MNSFLPARYTHHVFEDRVATKLNCNIDDLQFDQKKIFKLSTFKYVKGVPIILWTIKPVSRTLLMTQFFCHQLYAATIFAHIY